MATFMAYIKGSRGGVSRLGHRDIKADINGWNIGVKVYGYKNDDGTVEFHIYETSGSNGGMPDKKITVIKEKNDDEN